MKNRLFKLNSATINELYEQKQFLSSIVTLSKKIISDCL